MGGLAGVPLGSGEPPAPPHAASCLPPCRSRCCDKKSCGNRNETPSDPVIIDRYWAPLCALVGLREGGSRGCPRGAGAGSCLGWGAGVSLALMSSLWEPGRHGVPPVWLAGGGLVAAVPAHGDTAVVADRGVAVSLLLPRPIKHRNNPGAVRPRGQVTRDVWQPCAGAGAPWCCAESLACPHSMGVVY